MVHLHVDSGYGGRLDIDQAHTDAQTATNPRLRGARESSPPTGRSRGNAGIASALDWPC
ncbi:MAG: hypothetical protein H0W24_11025 [Lysobacter sp.]|nr:hypothetical protein [Lysobacter sp.]